MMQEMQDPHDGGRVTRKIVTLKMRYDLFTVKTQTAPRARWVDGIQDLCQSHKSVIGETMARIDAGGPRTIVLTQAADPRVAPFFRIKVHKPKWSLVAECGEYEKP